MKSIRPSPFRDFSLFLREYNIIALAIAFVMGTSTDALVKSIVNNLVMPLVQPIFAAGRWQDWAWHVGPFVFGLGAFFADALRFFVLAFLVYFLVKKIMRLEQVPKK